MIANVHADAIRRIDNAELIGVADNSYEFALKFAQKWGVKAFNDYIKEPHKDDLLIILGDTELHFPNGDRGIPALGRLR